MFQIVDVILSHPEHEVIIGIDTLGKEDLLHHIARVLKIKVLPIHFLRLSHTIQFATLGPFEFSIYRMQG